MTFILGQSDYEIVRRNLAICFLELLTKVTSVFKIIEIWRQREISRASFNMTAPNILKDAGISDSQRFIEGNKPFWEA